MLTIRPYHIDDDAAVIDLWERCGLVRPQNNPRKDLQRKSKVRPDLFRIGVVDGKIVATVMIGYEGHRGWINYLAVSPDHQRKGFGRRMMEEAERLLRLEGCPKINLLVRTSNAAVIGFYTALGYVHDDVVSLGKRLEHDQPDAKNPLSATMTIRVDDLAGPEIAAFLEEHLNDMRSVSPPESKHALDLDGLRKPEITFWTAWNDGRLAGCCALKQLDPAHGEIKSMRVAKNLRAHGVGSMLVNHVISEARARGLLRLSLETGAMPFFEPARRLYRRHGFDLCGPFGSYKLDPNSVFMTRVLDGK